MKKKVLLLCAVAAAMTMQASDVEQGFGLQFGFDRHLYRLNAPTVSGKDKYELNKQPLNGGKLGFVYDVSFYKGVGLFLGFNYSYTMHSSPWVTVAYNEFGQKTQYGGLQYRYKAEEHMLDWNILFQYKFELAGDTYLGFFTGPSIQYIAQYKSRDYFRTIDGTDIVPGTKLIGYDVNTEDIAPYYKNYNVTWGLGLMFQYDCYFIRGGYDFGLINPYKVTTFGEVTVSDDNGVPYPIFGNSTDTKSTDYRYPDQRLTRGRMDSWFICLGVFLWQSDK